jgi:Flp pilus assembly protein TadD
VHYVLVLAFAAQLDDPFQTGVKLFAQGRLEEARVHLERAVELRPNHAPSWKALGVVHAAAGAYERAQAPFQKACELDPKLEEACFYHGRTLYLLNRFEAALAALKPEKKSSRVLRIQALCLEGLRRTSEADAAFREAIRLGGPAPANEDPRIDYGVFLFREGRTAESLQPLQAAVRAQSDSARAQLELGRALLALERLAEAQGPLERAVALDGRSARAHLLLGRLYLRLGKPEAAEAHLRQGSQAVK